MSKPQLITISRQSAKEIVRLFDTTEHALCKGCDGKFHEGDCPAKEVSQLRNYLTQRINNPTKNFSV